MSRVGQSGRARDDWEGQMSRSSFSCFFFALNIEMHSMLLWLTFEYLNIPMTKWKSLLLSVYLIYKQAILERYV